MSAPSHHRYGWEHPAPPSWAQFALWIVVGPVVIVGFLAAFTPLIVLTTPVSVLLVLGISWRFGFNASTFGALSGVGVIPVVVGFVNLHNSDFAPWPWFVVAAVLFAAGIVGYHAVIKSAAGARVALGKQRKPSDSTPT